MIDKMTSTRKKRSKIKCSQGKIQQLDTQIKWRNTNNVLKERYKI